MELERHCLRVKSKVNISVAEIAMASFKKVQKMPCLCLVEEITDKEEFVLLYNTYRLRNLPFPHSAYEKFSLANKDPAECKADSEWKRGTFLCLLIH